MASCDLVAVRRGGHLTAHVVALKVVPAAQKRASLIALLSHPRKIIEKVIDTMLRLVYRFNEAQCGFRSHRSVETAILRALRAIRSGRRYVCVLDFRQAYASIPRGDVVQRAATLLPGALTNMFETLLTPTSISTVGDGERLRMDMRRGVPEGSPLSPALFNLVIDPLAEKVQAAAKGEWEIAINLFADDTILFAPSAAGMHRLLGACSSWAAAQVLSWDTHKCWALSQAEAP